MKDDVRGIFGSDSAGQLEALKAIKTLWDKYWDEHGFTIAKAEGKEAPHAR